LIEIAAVGQCCSRSAQPRKASGSIGMCSQCPLSNANYALVPTVTLTRWHQHHLLKPIVKHILKAIIKQATPSGTSLRPTVN
jgi:hypothetical protein